MDKVDTTTFVLDTGVSRVEIIHKEGLNVVFKKRNAPHVVLISLASKILSLLITALVLIAYVYVFVGVPVYMLITHPMFKEWVSFSADVKWVALIVPTILLPLFVKFVNMLLRLTGKGETEGFVFLLLYNLVITMGFITMLAISEELLYPDGPELSRALYESVLYFIPLARIIGSHVLDMMKRVVKLAILYPLMDLLGLDDRLIDDYISSFLRMGGRTIVFNQI